MRLLKKVRLWKATFFLSIYLILGSLWLGTAWREAKHVERLPFELTGVVKEYILVGRSLFGEEYTIVVAVRDAGGDEVNFKSPRTTVFRRYAIGQTVMVKGDTSSIPSKKSLPTAQAIGAMNQQQRAALTNWALARSPVLEIADPKHVWEEFWWSAGLATIAFLGLSAATFVLLKENPSSNTSQK